MRPATTLTLACCWLLILVAGDHLVCCGCWPLTPPTVAAHSVRLDWTLGAVVNIAAGGGSVNLASIIDGHPDDDVAIISRNRPTTYGAAARPGRTAARRAGRPRRRRGRSRRAAVRQRPVLRRGVPRRRSASARSPCRSTRTSPAPELARELATVGAKVVVVDPSRPARGRRRPRRRADASSTSSPPRPATHGGDFADTTFDDLLAAEPRRARRRRARRRSPC